MTRTKPKPTSAAIIKSSANMTRAQLLESTYKVRAAPPLVKHSRELTTCMQTFWTTITAMLEDGQPTPDVLKGASIAFRLAMPPMTSLESIRVFVDCVAHGICIGALDGKQASSLLYAAQVALGTCRDQKKTAGK